MDNLGKPIGGSYFAQHAPPDGLGMKLYLQADGRILAHATMHTSKEGPPRHAHGGTIATLLDEVMGAAAWNNGYKVLAANLNINFMSPVPLETPIRVIGEVARKEGRKVFTSGQVLLPDDSIAATGSGLFIEAPDFFGDADYTTPLT